MRHRFLTFIILSATCVVHAGESSKKSDMIAEMQASIDAIAKKYGNLPFTQIFTNEPARAAAVRKRFMEFEKMDSLQKQIGDLEQRNEKLNDELQAKEAIAADLDRKLTARHLEIQSAAAQAVAVSQGNDDAIEAKK